jgi:hypothetical protein
MESDGSSFYGTTTLSITTLSVQVLHAIVSKNDNQHNNALPLCCGRYAECRILFLKHTLYIYIEIFLRNFSTLNTKLLCS